MANGKAKRAVPVVQGGNKGIMKTTKREGIVEVSKSACSVRHMSIRDGPLGLFAAGCWADKVLPELGFYRVAVIVEAEALSKEEAEQYEWVWLDNGVGISKEEWDRRQRKRRKAKTGRDE